ncbi:hypothetical protein AAZX31_15G150900 [Glycine max]
MTHSSSFSNHCQLGPFFFSFLFFSPNSSPFFIFLLPLSKVLLLSFSLSPKQFAHKGGKMAPFVSLFLLLLFLNYPFISLSTNPEGSALHALRSRLSDPNNML